MDTIQLPDVICRGFSLTSARSQVASVRFPKRVFHRTRQDSIALCHAVPLRKPCGLLANESAVLQACPSIFISAKVDNLFLLKAARSQLKSMENLRQFALRNVSSSEKRSLTKSFLFCFSIIPSLHQHITCSPLRFA